MTRLSDDAKFRSMPYLIYAIDFEGKQEIRESLREAHRDHLKRQGMKILAAGALLSEDTGEVIGGITLLDTEDRMTAQNFADEDPYSKAGIRKELHVMFWRKRWWEGKFLLNENSY